jgi:hypothetical protein
MWIKENVEEVRAKALELETKRNEAVEKEIAEKSLSREKPEDMLAIKAMELRFDAERDAELATLMKPHQAAAFDAVAAEMGLTPIVIPPIVRSDTLQNPNLSDEKLSKAEKLRRTVRSQSVINQLFNLDVGAVNQPLAQPAIKGSLILITDLKREPPESEMIQFPKRVATASQGLTVQPDRGWGFEVFKRPDFFNLKSQTIDERLERERKDEEQRALRRAEAAARRAKIAMEREAANQGPQPPPDDK